MILKLIKLRKGSEFIKELELNYGSLDKLKRLLQKDPENALYQLDLEDWEHYLENPDDVVETRDTIFLNNETNLLMSDLTLLDIIKKENPKSIRNLSHILNKDIKSVQPKVSRLAEEGFIKFEHGAKNAKKPIVNYDKIEIEI